MTRSRTSIPRRIARLTHMAALLVKGLAICQFRFPRMTDTQKDHEIRRWSRRLLAASGMRVKAVGAPARWPERTMIATNHISWIDVFAVLAVAPGVFVAKSEIKSWPLIGRLVAEVGTLFIERERKSHVRRMNESIVAALASGRRVAICPEGTTTEGDQLLRFRAALLQPAIDARATLQPLGIRYLDAHGEFSRAAAYVGDMSLVASMWNIVSEPRMTAELRFSDALLSHEFDRRALARVAEERIAATLGVRAPSHRSPETAPHLEVAAL
jgi:1-acyl-sn-glycerol-3-phosphate acyltransferase